MKLVELLKIATPALKLLSDNEACRDDWRYVPLYEEFNQMRTYGIKYEEAVRMLAEDYHIGRATVERAVARLSKEVSFIDALSTNVKTSRSMRVKKQTL